jgi:hypothetical protein
VVFLQYYLATLFIWYRFRKTNGQFPGGVAAIVNSNKLRRQTFSMTASVAWSEEFQRFRAPQNLFFSLLLKKKLYPLLWLSLPLLDTTAGYYEIDDSQPEQTTCYGAECPVRKGVLGVLGVTLIVLLMTSPEELILMNGSDLMRQTADGGVVA